ncbi:PadR family transcriptional regulator, partial [Salmonella enterica subsp. enterica]|nr:PadR family transcriptional regulator [Salmonella enterica subsp. enterica]
MSRDKHLPLTETVYYILLALAEPAHGYLILQKVEELSRGQVRMAAGTLYGAIDNLVKLKWIEPVATADSRR